MVREIWFEKSGSRKVVDKKKRWFYTINPPFFRLEKSGWPEKKIRVCRTTFLEPLFYTFLEKWLQIKCSNGGTTNSEILGLRKFSYDEPVFFIGFEFNHPYPRFLVLISMLLFLQEIFLISIILQYQKWFVKVQLKIRIPISIAHI